MDYEKNNNKQSSTVTLTSQDWYQQFYGFVQLKGYRPNTEDNYLNWIRKFAEFHKRVDLPTFEYDQIAQYLLHLKNERALKPSTINQARSSLQLLYRDHLKFDWEEHWKHVRFKQQPSIPHIITRDEVELLLGSFEQNRYLALFTVTYQCGLRINEARHIKPKDINSQRNVLLVREGKGGKTREVPMNPALIDRLRTFYLAHQNSEWLFPATFGYYRKNSSLSLANAMRHGTQPMSVDSSRHAFRNACTKSGLMAAHDKIVPHTLRHSYATHMLEAGVSVRQLAAYLGHSCLESTMIYLHLTENSELKARTALMTLAGPQTTSRTSCLETPYS